MKPAKFNEVRDKIDNYIKFAAGKTASSQLSLSNHISAEDLYQEGNMLLLKCFEKYKHKGQEELLTIFKTSLWRHLRQIVNKPSHTVVDIEEAYDLGYTEDVVEKMFVECGLEHLEEMLKHDEIAQAILRELIQPSEKTIWEAHMDIARKKMLKSQGKRVNVPQSARVKMTHIRRSLEITQKKFDQGIAEVRRVAKLALQEDTAHHRY